MKNEIEKKAFDMAEELCEIRHCLHRIPELEFDVFETSEFIKSKLGEYGIPYKTVLKTHCRYWRKAELSLRPSIKA